MRFKVFTGNYYVLNEQPIKDALLLPTLHCDVYGIQEGQGGNAQKIRNTLKNLFTTFWGTSANKDIQRAMIDVPVVVDKDIDIIKMWARKVCDRSQEKNTGAPRAATVVRLHKRGRTITFINTHLNAGVQDTGTKLPFSMKIKRIYEYAKSIAVLELMIRAAQSRGDLVVLVGDLNYSVQKSGIWKFSPQALFNRTKLNFKSHHYDYIAYSRQFEANDFTVIPSSKTGSDHDWLTLTLFA